MRRFVLGLVGAAVVAGCSSGGGGGGPPPPPTTGAIRLFNDSSYIIDEVYVALSSSPSWGSNRALSEIAPGSSLTVGGLAPDYWDVEAVSFGTYSPYFAYAWDVPVGAGQTVELGALDSDFTGSLQVTNGNATYSLTGLYVVLDGSPSWGSNYITTPIGYGYHFLMYDMPPGYYYDVRCIHSNGGSSTGTYLVSAHALTSVTCY